MQQLDRRTIPGTYGSFPTDRQNAATEPVIRSSTSPGVMPDFLVVRIADAAGTHSRPPRQPGSQRRQVDGIDTPAGAMPQDQ